MLRFWLDNKTNSYFDDDNSLPKTIYRMLKSDADNNITYGGTNWAS